MSTYTLIGKTTEYRVRVPTGVNTKMLLNDVTMETFSPIEASGGTLNLEAADATINIVKCAGSVTFCSKAGIEINNRILCISGSGNLEDIDVMARPGICKTMVV